VPKFTYSARDSVGTLVKGTVDASNRKEAIRQIMLQRLQPVSVIEPHGGGRSSPAAATATATAPAAPATTGANLRRLFQKGEARAEPAAVRGDRPRPATGLGRKLRLPFLRSLSELVASGMPVGDAIRLLSVRLKDPQLQALSQALWERVSGGKSISEAMADIPSVFDRSTVFLVESGEATGNLKEILNRLVKHFEDQKELQNKITTAMAYPALIMLVAVGVVLLCVFVLLPRLDTMLSSLGGQMPLSTRILMAGSDFALAYGLFILVGLVLAGLAWWQWKKTPAGSMAWDTFILRVPIVGNFLRTADVLQMSQTMSVLLENGVTTVEALRMTENVIANERIRASFGEARQKVVEGKSISHALQGTGQLPQLVLDMLAVGENTGNIVFSLKQIGELFQKEISRQLQAFIGVLSIGVLLVVFSFVGFIAFAIIAAVFQMSASFSL
jgi:general secretion pathway protein F